MPPPRRYGQYTDRHANRYGHMPIYPEPPPQQRRRYGQCIQQHTPGFSHMPNLQKGSTVTVWSTYPTARLPVLSFAPKWPNPCLHVSVYIQLSTSDGHTPYNITPPGMELRVWSIRSDTAPFRMVMLPYKFRCGAPGPYYTATTTAS